MDTLLSITEGLLFYNSKQTANLAIKKLKRTFPPNATLKKTFYFFTTDSLSISILLPLFISLSSILLSHLGAIPSGILGFPGPESSNVRLIVAWDSPEAFRATALYCPASPAYEQNLKMDFNRRLGLTRSVPRHHLILPRVSQRLLPVYKI